MRVVQSAVLCWALVASPAGADRVDDYVRRSWSPATFPGSPSPSSKMGAS